MVSTADVKTKPLPGKRLLIVKKIHLYFAVVSFRNASKTNLELLHDLKLSTKEEITYSFKGEEYPRYAITPVFKLSHNKLIDVRLLYRPIRMPSQKT